MEKWENREFGCAGGGDTVIIVIPAKAGIQTFDNCTNTWIPAGVYPRENGDGNDNE